MKKSGSSIIPGLLVTEQEQILADWMREQKAALTARFDLLSEAQLRLQSSEFLGLVAAACRDASMTDLSAEGWRKALGFLADLARQRLEVGFDPSETATFVMSLKQPVFARLGARLGSDSAELMREIWNATVLLDKLALYTTEYYQKTRNEIIHRQQQEMLELSTPVVSLWDGILALPLIGTLDSGRTQVVMENLLESIVRTGSTIAIIDITGVPTVDTLVAQHLMKTLAAAKLMGAQCVISGIRPQIAQTMVHLGVAFDDVVTKAALSDALAYALHQRGLVVSDGKRRG